MFSGREHDFRHSCMHGQRTADIANDIPLDHVRWFLRYATRLKEPYLAKALLASGAAEDEAARFARALVARIRQLEAAVQSAQR